VTGGGRRDAKGSGGVLPGSGGSERGATIGAAMPMSVRLPGGIASAVSGRSLMGFSFGLAGGSALGRSLVFVSTAGAGIPMSVRLPAAPPPPLALAPSGRVLAVARDAPVAAAGMLDVELAGRGGALDTFGGALDTFGGTLDAGRGGALAGRGGSLGGFDVAAGEGAFG
jgi:hypothetical protein